MTRTGVSLARLTSVALVIGGLSTIGWLVWDRSGGLVPEPPLLAALLLGLLIIFVLWTAWPVRARVRGSSTAPLDPLRAARSVVLAQAAALTGAALTGWYAGQLAVVVANLDLMVYRERVWLVALLAVASLLLGAAGLLAQSWCRVDRSGEDDRDSGRDRTGGDDNGRRSVS